MRLFIRIALLLALVAALFASSVSAKSDSISHGVEDWIKVSSNPAFASRRDVPVPTDNQNIGETLTTPLYDGISKLTAYTGIYGAFLIVSGVALVFFGHKLFKPLLFIAGFYLFSVVTFVILQNIEYSSKQSIGGGSRDLVYFIACLIVGLVGGGLAVCLWRFGFFAIGAGLGYALSLLFLTALKDVITSSTARFITIAVFVIAFGVLIFFFEMPILIAATSVGGAYATFVGIDIFAQTGFVENARYITSGKSLSLDFGSKGFWMLGGCVLLALVGIAVQLREIRRSTLDCLTVTLTEVD
ncbi:hypothetical protein HDU99_006783 [Rhizoclosmatium hyalinum]|nr:hypothetical protein HDU99_006783 [Rhizoclosmatium hyalinum]